MKITSNKDYTVITGLTKQELDLNKTFNCGQSFRWQKVAQDTYKGLVKTSPIIIKEHTFEDGNFGFVTSLDARKCEDILVPYLGLNTNYNKLINLENLDKFAKDAALFGMGIRILRQDPWETLVSFIISQRNNIPKITSTIDRLCRALGNELNYTVGNRQFTDYTFPTCEKIIQVGIQGLQGLGLGYRDEYILGAAQAVYNKRIDLDYLNSSKVSGDEAVSELMELYGVGPKVANCVALFGLGKLDMFPIDVWIQRVISEYYPNGIDISLYGKLAGLIQQYMFYYIKNKT